MKKIISIICIVALLVTSIGMTFTNVAAAPVTAQGSDTVYWPTFTDDEGNAWYPYGPSDAPIPESVMPLGSATIATNTTGLPFTGLFEIPSQTSGAQINIEGTSGKGIIFYVKAPETVDNAAFQLGMYLSVYNSTTEQTRYIARYNCNGVKYAAIGDSSWSSFSGGSAYSLTLNSGFEGYVYYPFSVPNYRPAAPVGDDAYDSATDIFTGIRFTKTDVIPEGESLIVSAPIVVKEADTDPSAEYIVVGGKTYKLDGTGLVGDGTDYVKPSLNNVATATLPALSASATNASSRYSTNNVISSSSSITALTTANSVSYTHYKGAISSGLHQNTHNICEYTFSESVAVSNYDGYLIYIDSSAITDTANPVLFGLKLLKANSTSNAYIYGPATVTNHTREVYYLSDDVAVENVWETITLPDTKDTSTAYSNKEGSYGVKLPAGFKGYLYVPKTTFSQDASSWSISGFNTYLMSQAATDNTKTLKVSAPMMVDGFDSSSTVISGDACVLDLATGEKYVEGYDEVATPFYGDETALYYDRDSVAQITPAALATDTFYHPDFGFVNDDGNFKFKDTKYPTTPTLVSSTSAALKSPLFKITSTNAVTGAAGDIVTKFSESFTADKALMYYIKNGNAEASYMYSTIRYYADPESSALTSALARTINANNYELRCQYVKLISTDGTVYDRVLDSSKSAPTVIIPANFEGYLYIDVFNAYDLGDLTEIVPAQLYSGLTLAANSTFYLGMPMVVSGEKEYFLKSGVAYINGAEVPQNVKGEFTIPYDHNGDLKVNILDLVKADLSNTSDYALMRENYFDISVDSAAVASVFTER